MASIRNFQNSVCALAGLTIAYWICILVGAVQGVGYVVTLMTAGAFWLISSRNSKNQEMNYDKWFFILLGMSIFLAFATSSLYAFNPDDSTFFHRIAFLRLQNEIFSPDYDTRIAFDRLPPISAAHLITSWEYFLSGIGNLLGSDVAGYQIGGTFVSIIIYVFSVNYTVSHFFPKSSAATRVLAAASVILFLFFDADQNRRIGAWIFLGGWTGKCFLSASLIALFPAFDRAYKTNRPGDWFFVFCLIILFLGLTGSSLFILPIAIVSLIISEIIVNNSAKNRYFPAILVALPIIVGAVFIYKFGNLKDDSYWKVSEAMPFSDYVRLTISNRSFLLYLTLIPILLSKGLEINRKALIAFSLYQFLLALILLNPLSLPIFHKIVPSDGFWRIYYLFQYPTIAAMLGMIFLEFLKRRAYKKSLFPGVFLILSIAIGSSVFTLQKKWGYPHHFKRVFQEKLPEIELRSVKKAAESCRHFNDFGVVLAPEQWEVTAQMIAPSLTSIAARHMRHNFLNADTSQINFPEGVRLRAKNYASGLQPGSAEDFKLFIYNGVDIVALSAKVEIDANSILANYKKVFSDENYVVFCRN